MDESTKQEFKKVYTTIKENDVKILKHLKDLAELDKNSFKKTYQDFTRYIDEKTARDNKIIKTRKFDGKYFDAFINVICAMITNLIPTLLTIFTKK